MLSDVLRLSMQTINVDNETYKNATEATVFGPFFVEDAPQISNGGDISGGASGQACWVEGTVRTRRETQYPTLALKFGKRTKTVSTTFNIPIGALLAGRIFSQTAWGSAALALTPTPYPSRMTVRSARCWKQPGDPLCVHPTFCMVSPLNLDTGNTFS